MQKSSSQETIDHNHNHPKSCDIQHPSSRSNNQVDLRFVQPPSTFCRNAPTRPDVPKELLATIRQSKASEIARYEVASWSETPIQRREWEDAFKQLDHIRECSK